VTLKRLVIQALAEAVGELEKQQQEFRNEIRHELQQFQASALGWSRKAASDSVKQLLIEANVLDSDGKKAHPSLKAKSPKQSATALPTAWSIAIRARDEHGTRRRSYRHVSE
jgi:hypothetical protein